MVVAFVDDSINITVLRPAFIRVSRNIGSLLRDFEPAAVELVDIISPNNLALAFVNIEQCHPQNIALSVGILHQNLIATPYYFRNQTIFVREVTFSFYSKYFPFIDVVKL